MNSNVSVILMRIYEARRDALAGEYDVLHATALRIPTGLREVEDVIDCFYERRAICLHCA